MAFIIPWIFRAGTKAKSAEVNENFLAVKQFVDLLEEDVAANQIMVQTLDDTKANVNGNPTERFQSANAIVDNDVVNLRTLKTNTENSMGYIDGYRLSATSKKVTAAKGSCYSYDPQTEDYEYLIKSTTAISSDTLTLGANAKYYVFVCGDSAGAEYPKLSIGTNNTTPSLPAGLDCWRRIGYLTTDKDGNIDEILNEGQQSLVSCTKYPNYTSRVNRNLNTTYTATTAGWVYIFGVSNNHQTVNYKINGLNFILTKNYNNDTDTASGAVWFPVSKGDTYRYDSAGLNNTERGNGYEFYYVSNKS